ncbi:MAG: hypothetical protein HOK65_09750 [Crocinitomicaceae bacterium]|nr:hypothetical protein [Crocinitomicaceae bacterium]
MVKLINRYIIAILVLSSIYAFYVYNDVDKWVPFVFETIVGFTCLLSLLLLLKLNYKWQSLFYLKKRKEDFLFCAVVSTEFNQRILLYELLDILTYGAITMLYFFFPNPGWVIGCILAFAFAEGFIYSILNYNKFKIGVTSNVIVLATNRPNIIRVRKLKAILNKGGNYVFQHKDGRVDTIESAWISQEHTGHFNDSLENISKKMGIFLDDFNA